MPDKKRFRDATFGERHIDVPQPVVSEDGSTTTLPLLFLCWTHGGILGSCPYCAEIPFGDATQRPEWDRRGSDDMSPATRSRAVHLYRLLHG